MCATSFALDRDRSIAQFTHTAWRAKDGAPTQISALAQTEDGYLWIGSALGLFRFDGVRFEEYEPPPEVKLPSHNIYSLLATPDGGLWIAFRPNGLGFLKNGSFTMFDRPAELPDSPIHNFAYDHDGRVWAGTETGLVLREGTRWTPIGRDWNLDPKMITALFVDRDGTLWVATTHTIAFLKRGSREFELTGMVLKYAVTDFAQAKDGQVWFASDWIGIARPIPIAGRNKGEHYPAVVLDGLFKLHFDREGALWIAAFDFGVGRVRYPERMGDRKFRSGNPELESLNEKGGLSGGLANQLLEDREGNIWVACTKGLDRFRQAPVVSVSLPPDYQRLVLSGAKDGGLWIASSYSGLFGYLGRNGFRPKLSDFSASSVFRESNVDMWWGTRHGIWRQRGTSFDFFPLPKAATPDWIYEIFPSRDDGGLWIKLGDVGFVHFKQGAWNLNDWPKGVPRVGGTFGYGPSASYPDTSGQVWLGYTSGQVCLLDGRQVRVFSQNDGLDLGRIKVIRGFGQHIWVGGELGLMLFSGGRFRRVAVAGGQQFGAVSGIVETANFGLWLNEQRGIVQIPPDEIRKFVADPNHSVSYRRFDYLDGLPGAPQMNFTNATAVQTSDGHLWFSTDNGLATIDPVRIAKNVVPPPVSIRSISNEKGPKTISNLIRFAAGTRALEIDYTALSLTMPERVEFRYKLVDVDPDWHDVGTRRQAFYTNLDPGRYRFRVIACNNDGLWNEQGAELNFEILPPWWSTWWFRTFCAAAFLLFVFAAYSYRLRQIARQFESRMEARVAERTRIARELHDTLLQSFQGLMFRFQAALDLLPDRPNEAIQLLGTALDHGDKAIVEGRDAVQGLRASTVIDNDLIRRLAIVAEELAALQKGEARSTFGLLIEGSARVLDPILQDEIYRIAREALTNAFRHSGARKIEAEITYGDQLFLMRIRDDGAGIAPGILELGNQARHWGLTGMRERAKALGGQLDVWSQEGAGTEVSLTIPKSIAYRIHSARRRFRSFWRKSATDEQRS